MESITSLNASKKLPSIKEIHEENEQLKKTNFNLQLKVYYLVEKLSQLHPQNVDQLLKQVY